VASVRCAAPADAEEARVQLAMLARICGALSGVPLVRRGPVTRPLLALLPGSPVRACEDDGQAAARAVDLIPWDLLVEERAPEETRANRLERAAAELSQDGADRLEARAYVEVMDFVEALGAAGSARAVSRALERRLEDR
jgi:hypothetical protein